MTAAQIAAAVPGPDAAETAAGNNRRPSGPAEHLAHLAFITACYESVRQRTAINPKELL